MIATLLAFLLAAGLTPVCRTLCRRLGWVDHPDARKQHRVPVPRAGGIAILLGYGAAMVWARQWSLLPAVAAAFGTGLLDDVVSVKPRTKIAGQVLAALLACAAGVELGGGRSWWHAALTVVWLVGCTNAVNLIDGLDGLAAGVGIIATGAALVAGNGALALVAAPLMGALLGFLPYNFGPASIFMGDCGSNAVGFLLGCFTVLWAQKSGSLAGMSAPVIALAIPILDTALAIVRRYLRSDPIFGADRGHIHHRLLARGFSVRQTALILYGGAACFACLSLLLAAGAYSSGPVLAGFGVVIWLALRYLRYEELGAVRRVLGGGRVRRAVRSELAVRQLETAIRAAESIDECWFAMEDHGGSLGLAGATMQVYGRTLTARFGDAETAGGCWSLRVELNGAGSIEVEVPYGRSECAGPVATLVRDAMAPKLETLRPQRAFAAAAGRGSFRRIG
ncbi:MAG TPA: MraY family glycosyltransferase [Bryobacteraceae bacterium]|jgi:UDP-GlcNAc:undecaprenyl-phosphate GlcNAc-1-phosphate transferase|nr:MraY family glycosyltransferase [Bryobacteraceae bacterium]